MASFLDDLFVSSSVPNASDGQVGQCVRVGVGGVYELASVVPSTAIGDVGKVLAVNAAGGVALGTLTGGGVLQWVTVADIHYSALATGTDSVLSSFAHDIGGVTHTVAGSSKATEFRVVNGTGLKIDHDNTSSSYWQATATCPRITIPLATLAPGYPAQAPIRISAITSISGAVGNYEQLFVGLEGSGASRSYRATFYKGYDSGLAGNTHYPGITLNSISEMRQGGNAPSYNNDDVLVVEQVMPGDFAFLFGQSSAGAFPAGSSLKVCGRYRFGAYTTINTAIGWSTDNVQPVSYDTPSIVFGVKTDRTNSTIVGSLARLKVEVLGVSLSGLT